MDDVSEEREDDSKVAAKKIKIGARLSIAKFVELSISYMRKYCGKEASNSEYSSMASNSGERSMASNSGYSSMASNSGCSSMASNSGDSSMAEVTGEFGLAVNHGIGGKARGALGCWLVLSEWRVNPQSNRYELRCVKSAKVDGEHIKPDTFYTLMDGDFVESEGEGK